MRRHFTDPERLTLLQDYLNGRDKKTVFERHQIDTKHMIRHSDRGGQYTSSSYTELLCQRECLISMPQTGDPLHNTLAERINGTTKNSWYVSDPEMSFEKVSCAVDRAVERYNAHRASPADPSLKPIRCERFAPKGYP